MRRILLYAAGVFSVVFLLGVLFHSCAGELRENGSKDAGFPLNERLSLYDARLFFSEYEAGLALGPVTGTRSEFSVPQLSWDSAGFSEFLGYEVIEVPFEGMVFSLVPAEESNSERSANTSVKLLSGLDSYGEIYYRILFIRADEDFLDRTGITAVGLTLDRIRENFSGDLLLYETGGSYVKGFRIVEGEIYSGIWMEEATQERVATRSSEDDCIYFVIDWFWCLDGAPESCVYDYTEILERVCPNEPPAEADPGGGGGGAPPGNNTPPNDPPPCDLCGKNPCVCCTACHKFPCVCEEPEDPCKSMKLKSRDAAFNSRITNLQGWTAQGNTRETAYTYLLGSNGQYQFSQRMVSDNNNPAINLSVSNQPQWDGIMHSHYPGCGNVFSFNDLLTPMQAHVTGRLNDIKSFSSGLITPEGVIFFTIDDHAAYLGFANRVLTNENLYQELEDEFYGDNHYNIQADLSMSTALESLLRFMNDYNTGITVFKRNSDNQFDKVSLNIKGEIYILDCDD